MSASILRGTDEHGPLVGVTVLSPDRANMLRAGWRALSPDSRWVPADLATFAIGEPGTVVLYLSDHAEVHALNAAELAGGIAAEVRLVQGRPMFVAKERAKP